MAVKNTEGIKVDNVEVKVYEPPEIHSWEQFRTGAKIAISEEQGVIQTTTARNTTTLDMHDWLVARTDPNGSTGPNINELALGRSNTATNESDTELNDEVDRAPITSTNREGDTLRVTTFLDKAVGNVDVSSGESLSEIGLYADSFFLNHAVLNDDIEKTSNKTATIDVLITYDSV